MNATYTVTFKGIRSERALADLDKWLREDIAFYPKRLKMDSASVAAVVKPKRDVPIADVRAAVKKVKADAKG